MTTNVDVLKDALYDKIADINDEKVLEAIETLVDNIKTDVLGEATTSKRDLTSYIKEWAKSV
ncbi:hypothetical protein RRF68_10900 [Tenacibaculum sp. HL-MS23]|uniref:hypothetical protein n=1 Tax=Tenacibaculum sp. HL-MS23 TaxID=3077734 RepID=UPI0028FC1F5E|nr:hypothetical protein [Tenacibaculum sp. HL-MS23]WNW01493.1 hypothetical protein RRF68_10900 [Tenacibaculum sp. HL-MS23]